MDSAVAADCRGQGHRRPSRASPSLWKIKLSEGRGAVLFTYRTIVLKLRYSISLRFSVSDCWPSVTPIIKGSLSVLNHLARTNDHNFQLEILLPCFWFDSHSLDFFVLVFTYILVVSPSLLLLLIVRT